VSCFTTTNNMDLYAMGWYANETTKYRWRKPNNHRNWNIDNRAAKASFFGLFIGKTQFLRRKILIPLEVPKKCVKWIPYVLAYKRESESLQSKLIHKFRRNGSTKANWTCGGIKQYGDEEDKVNHAFKELSEIKDFLWIYWIRNQVRFYFLFDKKPLT
jgi:hypothetical protein